MTTSGTVNQTSLDVSTILEHAFRRVKVHPSKQTPEKVQLAKDNLYLLLTNLSNRGLNLWAIEKRVIGLEEGKATYVCPDGTIDLLNLVYSQATRVTGTDVTTATRVTSTLASATNVPRIGVKVSATAATNTLTLEGSTDGVTFTTLVTETRTNWAAGEWYWYDVPVVNDYTVYRATFATAVTFTEFYLASVIYDLPVSAWSRDVFSVINNKTASGRPATCYFFEKLINPQATIWPIPNNSYDQLTMYVHRMVQDVGTLTQTLEIPGRWLEAIIWQLASRLAFELEEVDAQLIPIIVQMADKYMDEAEGEESDGMPFYLAPQIAVYTR